MTRSELAARIKAKYPDYADMDDNDLVTKVVAKYPEYGEGLTEATNSIDATLGAPHAGSTVADEIAVKDTTVPGDDTTPSPAWALLTPGTPSPTLGRGIAKGLGQAGVNLWRSAGQLQERFAPGVAAEMQEAVGFGPFAPPPEMPEALRTEGSLEGLGALGGRVAPGVAASIVAPGTIPMQAAAGAFGGAASTGSDLGALSGGVLGGLGQAVSPLAGKVAEAVRRYGPTAVKGALEKVPILGSMGRGAVQAVKKKMGQELAEATLAAKAASPAGVTPPPTSTGALPRASVVEEAFPPPPSFKPSASTSTTGKVTETVSPKAVTQPSAAPAAPPKAKVSLDEAMSRFSAAKTPQERGAIIRELAGGGHDKAARGAALSQATNKPLDPDDLAEAKAFLKEAGSLEEALRLIREHPENSVQDVIKLTRAVREASRAK